MPRKAELLTISDVAEMLQIKESTVTSYRARGYMPKPDVMYGRTPLWRIRTIRAWHLARSGK